MTVDLYKRERERDDTRGLDLEYSSICLPCKGLHETV